MRKVIVDDPLAPSELKPVPIKTNAGEKPIAIFTARRRWVECHPAVGGEVDFDPAVRIALPDDVLAAEIIVLTWQKAGDVARRDSDGTKHYRHGGSEVFAVASAADKQKIGEWVGTMR